MDERCKLVGLVALRAGESKKLPNAGDDRPLLWGSADAHTHSSTELKQALIPKSTQRLEDRVGVDAHHRREVLRRGQTSPWTGIAFSYGPTNLGGYLLVQRGGVCPVDAFQHR